MTDQLDTSKLIPLDVTGLEPIDDKSKPLDVSALEPLDVSGLEPVDAPPVQPVAVAQPQAEPVSSVFAPAAGSSSQSYPAPTGVAPTQSAVPKTIWNQNDGTFHQKLKPSEPVGIVFNGKKMMATYNPVTNKFTTDIDDTSRVVGKKPVVRPAEFDRNAYSLDGMQPPADQIEMHDVFAKVEIDPSQVQAYTEGQGALRSIRNTAMRALPPTATSFAAFNAAGIPAAAWAGRVHPYLAPVGLVVGGGLAAMGAGAVTDLGVNAAFPLDETDELNQLLYPTENAITQQGVAFAALRPSLKTLAGMATLQGPALTAGAKGAAINTALAGQHRLVEEISSDKPMDLAHVFDPKQMLNDAAVGGFLMHKATAMGKAFEHPGKVLGAKLSPRARPEDATQSTKDVRAANEPLDTSGLEPVAQGNVPARPFPEGKTKFSELTAEEFKAITDWDAQYGKTHDNTGKPLNRDENTVAVDVEIKDKPNAPSVPKPENPVVPTRPKVPDVDNGTAAEWEIYWKASKEWDAKYDATHWADGNAKSQQVIDQQRRIREEREAREATEAGGEKLPPVSETIPPVNTVEKAPPAPIRPGENATSEQDAAWNKEFSTWLEKYGQTHDLFGNPKVEDKNRVLSSQERSARTADHNRKIKEVEDRPIAETAEEAVRQAEEDYDAWISGSAQKLRAQAKAESTSDSNKGLELVNQAELIEAKTKRLRDLQKAADENPEKYGPIADAAFDHIAKLQQKAREQGERPPAPTGTPKSVEMLDAEAAASKPPSEPVIPEAKESSPEVQLAHLREQRDRLAATQPEPGTTQEAQLKKLEKAVDDLEEKLKEPNSQVGLVRNEGFTPGEVEALQKLTLDSMKKRLAEMEASGRGDSKDAKKLRDNIAAREKRSVESGNEPIKPAQQDVPAEPKDKAPNAEPSVETAPAGTKSYEDQKNIVKGLERQLAAIDKRKPDKYTEKQKEKIKATLDRERATLDAMPVPAEGDKPKKERVPRKVSYDDASLKHINANHFSINVKKGGSERISLQKIKETMPHLYDKALKMYNEAEAESVADFKRVEVEIKRFAAEARKIADSDMTIEQKRKALSELDDRVTNAKLGSATYEGEVFVGIDENLIPDIKNDPRPVDVQQAEARKFPVDDPANGWREGTSEASKLHRNINMGAQSRSTLSGIQIHLGEALDAFEQGRAADALVMAQEAKGLSETLEGRARREAKKTLDSFEKETGINIGKSIEAEETDFSGDPVKGVPFPDSGPATEGLVNKKGSKKNFKNDPAEVIRERIEDLQERADELEENDPDGAEELRIKASKLQEKLDAMDAAEQPQEQAAKPDKSGKEAPVNEPEGFDTEIGGIKFRSENIKMLDSEEEATRYTFVKKTSPGKGALIGIDIGTDHITGDLSVRLISDTGKRHSDGTVLELHQSADLVIPKGIKTVDQLFNLLKKGTLTESGENWNSKKPGKDAKAIKKLLDSVSGEGEAGQGAKPKPKVTPPDAGQGKDPKDAPFDYDKVQKAFNAVQDVGDYKPMGGTKAKAAGRIENIIKQLEKIFPDIRDASLSEENLKSMPMPYDTTTRAEALAEPDIRAKTISRYLSRKMQPYRDFAYEQKNPVKKPVAKDQPVEEPVDLAEEDVPPGQEKRITETKKQIARYESIKNKEAWHKDELKRLNETLAAQQSASSAYHGEDRVRAGFDKLGKLYNQAADAYNNSKPREAVEAEFTAQIHALRDFGVSQKDISNWLYYGHEKTKGPPFPGMVGDAFSSYKDPYPDVKRRTFDEVFTRHQTPGNSKPDNSYSEWDGSEPRKMLSQLIWFGNRKRDSRGGWHGGWGLQIFRTPGEPGYKTLNFGFDTKEGLMAEYDKLLRMHSFKYRSEKTAISHTEGLIVPKLSGFDPADIEAANKRTNTLKDIEKHPLVESISDERDRDGNGIWVYLKDGFVNDATNTGAIHEDTVPGVLKLLKRASFDIRETESDKFEAGRKAAKDARAQSQAEANEVALRAMEAAETTKTKPVQEAAKEPAEKKYPIEKLEDALAEKDLKILRRNNTDDFVAEGGVEENGRQRPTLVVGDTKITLASEGMELVNGKVQIMDGQEKDAAGNVIYNIERIVTAPEGRGKGSASKALDALTEAADKAGLTLQLEPTPFRSIIGKGESMNKGQLIEWYKRNGFEQKTEGSDAILIRKPGAKASGAKESIVDTKYEGDVESAKDALWKMKESDRKAESPEAKALEAELIERGVLDKDGTVKRVKGKTALDTYQFEGETWRIDGIGKGREPDITIRNLETGETKVVKKESLSGRDRAPWEEVMFDQNEAGFGPGLPSKEIPSAIKYLEGVIKKNEAILSGSPSKVEAKRARDRIKYAKKEIEGQKSWLPKPKEGTTLDMRRDPNNDANDAFDAEARKAKELDRRVAQNAENREAGKDEDGGRRGFIGIMDRAVSEARMRGEITDKEVEGLSRIINYVGSQFFDGVKMSIRQGRPGHQGQYDSANRIVTIFKEAIQRGRFEDTAGHEVGHHLEQFLPEGDRAALRAEWLAARKKFTDKWSVFGRLVEGSDNWAKVKISKEAYAEAASDFPTLDRFVSPARNKKGEITHYEVRPTDEMYRLFTPREWFAETFKEAAREKLNNDPAYTGEQPGWKQKIAGVWNSIKTAFAQVFGKEQAKRILANFAKGRYKPEDADPSVYSEPKMSSKKDVEEATRLTPEERDAIDQAREVDRNLARGEKPELTAGGKVWRSVVDHPVVAWFKPLSMRLRTIADLNPQSEALQKVVNDFSLIPGKEAEAPDYNTDSANMRNVFFNKLTKAFGPVLEDMRKMGPAELKEFNSLFIKVVEGRAPRQVGGRVGEAIKEVGIVLAEMHKYGIDSGLKLGKVEGFFPRSVDANAVDADKAGFVRAATKAYEVQFERLKQEAKDEAVKNGTEYVEAETPDFDMMARKWRDAILLGREGLDFEHGIFEEPRQGTKESFQKKREFTKDEALLFDAYRDKDVERTVINYVGGLVRKAEVSRRIGVDNGAWGKIKSEMDKQGVDPKDIAEIEQLIKSNIGIGGKRMGEETQQALDFTKLISNAAYLKLTGLLNITEAASMGVRTESASDSVKAVWQMFRRTGNIVGRLTPEQTTNAKNEIERIYGKGHDLASALAIEFGINTIDRGFGTIASGYHLDGGSDYQGKLNKASDGVYKMYGIHATEAAKREISLRIGADFIDTNIKWLEGTHNLQRIARAMGKDAKADNLAKDRLKELGLKDSDLAEFTEWVKEMRKGNETQQLQAIMGGDPMAAKYRQALIIFNKQSSVQASRSSRTESANDTALGRMFFQFSTFTNEWSAQHGRRMQEQSRKIVGDNKYNATERMLMAGVGPAFAVATAATYGIRTIINMLTGFEFKDGDRVPAWVKSMADAFVYTGMLGPAEILWKAISRGQLPAGVVGDWAKKAWTAGAAMIENPDSNAAQRAVASVGYRSAFVPAANAGLALATEMAPMPVKLGAGLAAQAIANNRTEKAVADLFAGEKQERGSSQTPEPTVPPKPRPPSR